MRFLDIFATFYNNNKNQEFMVAIDMTAGGTPEEKLKWAFKMYDRNDSGMAKIAVVTKVAKIDLDNF